MENKMRGRVAWSSHPSEFANQFEVPPDLVQPRLVGLGANSGFLPFDALAALPLSAKGSDPQSKRWADAARQVARARHAARPVSGLTCPPSEAEELRQAWARWFSMHPVAHSHARAAASLKVREVDLLRALQGQGVFALQPDLELLLTPLPEWGRVIVEVGHSLGTGWLALTPRHLRFERGHALMHDTDRQIVLRGNACTDCFLVNCAGSCALHFFGELGEVIARMHLCAPNDSEAGRAAMRHLKENSRISDEAMNVGNAHTDRLTRPGWCAIERQVTSTDALAVLCREIGHTLDEAPPMQVALEAEHAILACQATAVHRATAQSSPQLGVRPCKLFFRTSAVKHAAVCVGPDGQPFLRLHAQDGSCLRLQRGGSQGESRAWVQAMLN
jgi:hypothetical protein